MNSLHLYHKLLAQFCQWFPKERITRKRNLAWLVAGLYLGANIHLPHIVNQLPLPGQHPQFGEPACAVFSIILASGFGNGIDRWPFRCCVRLWADRLHLVIDTTKVSFHFRLLTVSLVYRKRTLPLAWSVHRGSKGHISAGEQIELLNYVRSLLPARSQVWVLGRCGFPVGAPAALVGQATLAFRDPPTRQQSGLLERSKLDQAEQPPAGSGSDPLHRLGAPGTKSECGLVLVDLALGNAEKTNPGFWSRPSGR